MTYPVIFERISEAEMEGGYYYAHLPALGLTTHGVGVDGARVAILDLLELWVAEKRAAGEPVTAPEEFLFSTVELREDALQTA